MQVHSNYSYTHIHIHNYTYICENCVHIAIDMNLIVLVCVLQLKPGLSAYAQNPQQAAESLVSLLDKAESVVPRELRSKTQVRVGVCGCVFLFIGVCVLFSVYV